MDIKVYITNLAAYNAGYLKGEWINLSEVSEEELNIAIKRVLGNNEEMFITDYEAPFKIEEYANVHELREIAEQVADWQDYQIAGFVHLINEGCGLSEAVEKAEDVCIEQAESFEDLAEQHVDEGYYGEIPETLQYYIDYEKIGRDLEMDYVELEYNGSRYFIDRNSY